ncbi:hypothetical protein [Alcaligenes sp. CHO6]|uniref:hypothetical protein n=1 Tax=Alcaligenes sp. CHO6 TaxID=3123298 RepID=UPI0030142692
MTNLKSPSTVGSNGDSVFKWIVLVVVVGSFPLWARFLGNAVSPTIIKDAIAISDLIAFSFLLAVTSMSESYDKDTLFGYVMGRKVLFWASVTSLILCSVFFALSMAGFENQDRAFQISWILVMANLAIGFFVSFE